MAALVRRGRLSQIASMQAAESADFVSVADYLATEGTSPVLHEYLGGLVNTMAGETFAHNPISQNWLFQICRRTKGGPGRVFINGVSAEFRHCHRSR